jgi:hypothetical protein
MPSTITRTVAPSGGDETTLNAAVSWFETNYPDFTSSDIVGEIVIQGDWTSSPDTTGVEISGITTDSTRYLHIKTTGDARHNGIYGGKVTAYALEPGEGVIGIDVTEIKYIRIEGLQIRGTDSGSGGAYGIELVHNTGGAAEQRVYNNILKGNMSGSSLSSHGIHAYSNNNTGSKEIKVWNNIIYNFVRSTADHRGIKVSGDSNSGITFNAYNNTIENCRTGLLQTFGTANSYNNGFSSCTVAKAGTVGGGTGDSSTTPTFVNEAGDDFHLASGDTTWKDTTSDQSSGLFSDDVDYESRSGSWDCGADEYVSTADADYVMTGRYLLTARSDGTTG